MANNDDIKWLYGKLKAKGYNIGSEQDFSNSLANEADRKWYYEKATDMGLNIGSMEDFNALYAPKHASKPVPVAKVPAAKDQPVLAARKQERAPWKPTAQEEANFYATLQAIQQEAHNTVADTNERLAREGTARAKNAFRVRRNNVGMNATPYRVGEKSNVIQTGQQFNPKTGKVDQTFMTEAGSEYKHREIADLEQGNIDDARERELDPVNTSLRDAYSERDRIDAAMKQRMKEIDEENNGVGSVFRQFVESSRQPGMTNPMQIYQMDDQYRQLESAARKNRAAIQTLEDKRDGKMNDFFHSIKTTALNGYNFTDGLAEINDAIALLDAQQHIQSINAKRQAGEPLNSEELLAEMVLRNDAFNNAVQGRYAQEYGSWATAGQMIPTSIDLMKDIMLTPGAGGIAKGIAGKVSNLGGKYLARQAGDAMTKSIAKKVGRGILKGTGVLLGAHTAGAVVSNTSGINRTAALMGTNIAGHTAVDGNGYKVEDDMGVLEAFADAERQMMRENGSEMFGEFIPGVGKFVNKGLEKMGLSKISGALTRIGNKQWYKQYNALLKAGGYNGIAGEGIEEYEGILFDALTGHAGEALDQIKNPRTHVDIWLGTAAMSAMMGAVPVTIQGLHTGQYYRYKHNTDNADKLASFRLGEDRWVPMRDRIDETPNEGMADVATEIINDESLHTEEKLAALKYIRNLTKMRGYNIGQMSNANEESEESREANESYADGYNAETNEEKQDTKNLYNLRRQKVEERFSAEGLARIDNDPITALNELGTDEQSRQIILDYVNSKQAYDGMIQRVRDDLDSRIEQSNAMVDARTNRTTGMVQGATMKQDDRKVYVLAGELVPYDDGTGIDVSASSASIIVRDAETGELEQVAPDSLLSIEEPQDPVEQKNVAAETIRQQYGNAAADVIDGVVSFNPGNTFTITGQDGQPHQVQIVPNEQGVVDNGDGTVNVSDGTNIFAVQKDLIQQQVNEQNQARVAEAERQREQELAAAQQQETAVRQQEWETNRPQYAFNDNLILRDADGNLIHGQIAAVEEADGLYVVDVDYPINGKFAPNMTREQIDDMIVEYNGQPVQKPQLAEVPQTDTVSPFGESDNESTAGVTATTGTPGATGAVSLETVEPGAEVTDDSTVQIQQEQRTEPDVNQQPSAIERIPKDEQGNPLYEQAETPDVAWDAIVEQTGGDEDMAAEIISDIIKEQETASAKAQKALKKVQDAKPETRKDGSAPTMEERIAAKKASKEALTSAQAEVDRTNAVLAAWQQIALTPQRRKNAEEERKRKEDAERKREEAEAVAAQKAEQEEAARIEREALNGVPDIINDTPQDARARGYRRVNGHKVNRQEPLLPIPGRDVSIKFSDDEITPGKVVVIDAAQLQPSHRQGRRNPSHFIDEAQPKERNDEASILSAEKIAGSIRPEEITSSVTAYTGAPTVNSRGEVIQGNNRSAALRSMWDSYPEQAAIYKQYLMDHAKDFGLNAADIANMEHPVLVNMLDVSDAEAIKLGQYVAQDTESGGTERIKPKNVLQKLGQDVKSFANILLQSADEDLSFSELVDRNGIDTLKWMNTRGYITPTQYQSAFDTKGNITAEAKNDLKGILYQSVFSGGNTQLEEMFSELPAKAQKAILATAFRDFDSAESERMITEIQNSIRAYHALLQDKRFREAKNYKEARSAVEGWKKQYQMDDVSGETYLPSDNFTNFALHLATIYKGESQTFIQNIFGRLYDMVQGTQEATLFEQPDNTPRTLAQAIYEVLNIQYDGQLRSNVLAGGSAAGQQRRQGSDGSAPSGERIEGGEQPADGTGGTEGSGRQSEVTPSLFQYFTGSLSELIAQAKQSSQGLIKKVIAPISSRLKDDLNNQGLQVDNNYNHVIDNNAIRHTLKKHSGKNEGKRGQIPITDADFENIRDVVEHYDGVEVVPGNTSAQRIIYHKAYQDGTVIFVEEQRVGRKELAAVTMWKKRNPNLTDANRTETTLISDLTEVSDYKDTTNRQKANELGENFDDAKRNDAFNRITKILFEDGKQETQVQARTDNGRETENYEGANGGEQKSERSETERKTGRSLYHDRSQGEIPGDGMAGESQHEDSLQDDRGEVSGLFGRRGKEISGSETYEGASGTEGISRIAVSEGLSEPPEDANVGRMNEISDRLLEIDNRLSELENQQGMFSEAERISLNMEKEELEREYKGLEQINAESRAIQEAEAATDQTPTDAQKAAGNYKKGHLKLDGYDVTIENPKGSQRTGTDQDGTTWSVTMNNTYGYIRGTEGVDGDHIDVFLSDNPSQGNVYVVDQVNQQTGEFDEHKVMYGFNSIEEAQAAYLANYSEGWKMGTITEVSKEEFKKWIQSSHRKTKPFAEYASVKKNVPLVQKPMRNGESTIIQEGITQSAKQSDREIVVSNFGKEFINKDGHNIHISGWDAASNTVNVRQNGERISMTEKEVAENIQSGQWMPKQETEAETEGTGLAPKTDGYNVERRFHKKNGTYIYAVNFAEKMPREQFLELKKRVKDFGGYYSSYGKGGFIFDKELDANNFVQAVLDPSGEMLDDKTPLALSDMRKESDRVSDANNKKSETVAEPAEQKASSVVSESHLVSDKRYEELKKRMKTKLGQLNMGIDPEMIAIGAEMAVYHIERGAHKFVDYAKSMIADLGDTIRPYLKSFYNAVRDMPEAVENGLVNEMTPYDEVRTFDVANFDNSQPDAFTTAQTVVAEQEINAKSDEAKQQIAEQRNAERRKENEQTTANTEIIISEAEAVASNAAGRIKEAGTEAEVETAQQKVDAQLQTIDEQLSNLGYLDNLHSGMRAVLKDGRNVLLTLVMHSGEQISATQFSKPRIDRLYASYRGSLIDFTPDEIDVDATIRLNETNPLQSVVPIEKDDVKSYNGYKVGDKVLYTPKQGSKTEKVIIHDFENYGEHKPILDTGLAPVLYEVVEWDDIKPISERKTREEVTNKSQKNVSSQKHISDLFGELFGGEILTENKEENGLQGNDAVRSEGLSTHNGRHEERLSGSNEKDSQRQAETSGRSDGGRENSGSSLNRDVRSGLSDTVENPKNTRNNHSERGVDHAPISVDARIDANIKAIELSQQLLESGETATPDQMAILRRFSGWGGLGKAFNSNTTSKRLQDLLGPEGFNQAVMSANSAYYTPAYVVDTLWDIAAQMGFKGGNILEGSAGIGNILGQMPVSISQHSNIQAVEIDQTSGNILSQLYPDAKVEIQGFEDTQVKNGTVDLAITNVPFVTGLRVNDTSGDKDLSRKFHNIHDFCIAKNVRKLREGGIGIFISSNGTLDNSKKLRDWVVNEGNSDFVGAFRMNNATFGGTSVTSDIIVIRKRINGQKSPYSIDVSTVSGERTAEFDTGDTRKVKGESIPIVKQVSMDYNQYFMQHPEYMAGNMRFGFEEGDTYRPTSKGLYPSKGKDQRKMLADFVEGFSEKDWKISHTDQLDNSKSVDSVSDASSAGKKVGEMYVKDGNLVIANLDGYYPLEVNANKVKGHTKVECFNAYSAIKEALAAVLDYQVKNDTDKGLQPLLDRLNKAYDDFVATYGHFNKNTAIAFLRNDVDYPNVFSLETYEETGDMSGKRIQHFGKTDVFKNRVVEKEKEPAPKNVKDGIIASIFKFGRIDIPYISGHLAKTETDIKNEILKSGYGFENPVTREIEVSFRYLSGNVREKLRQAEVNNEDGVYDRNIKALQEVLPMDIPAHLIDFTLGSSWIDPKLYDEYTLDRTGIEVQFTSAGGTWFMKAPTYGLNVEKNRSMGVVSEMLRKTIFGHTLIEAAIQNKSITVSQTSKKWDGTTETIIDKEATQACAARIDETRQDFKEWARQKMQTDPAMSAQMERVYNDMFNNYVPLSIPNEFIPEYFGGASHKFKMRPHQGKAIVRGTMQPLMLAHEVGTGKTFTLISTAMEMRRLGTARKPMIVVQNATVGQFVASAKELYPNARILTLEESDRSAEGRKNFYAKIRYNDWDMIVVPQSTFEFIPDSEERQMAFIQDKIEEKKMVLEQMKEADPDGNSMITRQAEREIEQLEGQLAEITDEAAKKRSASEQKKRAVSLQNMEVRAREMLDRRTDDVENFDDMGIDALLVDEAHEYKHLGFATAMQRGVKGVDPSYSKKSQGVYLKTQAILEKNNGRNVIFATGTPISNTAAELWTFMRYLMPADTMREYGIYYFDDFVRNFGNIQQMLEFTTSGKFRENNRFAGYVNLPELVRIWSSVSDTVLTREAGGVSDKIPDIEGGKAQDIYLPQTRALRSIMKYVKAELNRFDNMSGKEKKENSYIPLTMYGIAKAAAVDARLVQADAVDDPNSKTNEAVRQTLRSLKETEDYKGTIALFADNYQNKHSGFNLYDDIRDKLIKEGVPADQIVVMRPGMTIKKKLEIFDKVNKGEVRVIMGSTFTLGTGVNIQERLHTLIHIDAPNRPMDYTQRNGRILRQGNLHKQMNRSVRVLRFGVEDSLDVTAYQRLKTKGAIADSIMDGKNMLSNSMTNRVLEEEEDVFGDTVAQLSGSEYALLKNNAEKNVRKYESRKKQWQADQTYIHNVKPKIKAQIQQSDQLAKEQKQFLEDVNKAFSDGTFKGIKVGNQTFSTVESMSNFIKEYNKSISDAMKHIKGGGNAVTQKRSLTVSLGGFTFNIQTALSTGMVRSGGQLMPEVHRKMTYSCAELGLSEVPVHQGLLRNAIEDIVENVITGKDFSERAEAAERSASHYRSELAQLELREGKPFEFEKELEAAREQYEEYSEAMKKEMEDKEAKYAEMDASVDTANDISNLEEDDVLFRIDDTTNEEINRSFNEELERYQNGEMGVNEMFHLGMPQGVVRMFLPDLPIVMRPRIINKASHTKHNVNVDVLENLPERISEPVFVFRRSDNALGVLTEIKDRDGLNVCVAIELNKTIQDGGDYLVVNDIRSIHGRDAANLIKPIVYNNTLVYVDKKKALEWFSSASSNYQQEITNQELSDATKVVESFENPSISKENLREGTGIVSNSELSLANDPMAKVTGLSRIGSRQQAFADRERERMVDRVKQLAKKLHLDNVEIVTDANVLEGKRAKAKGFYSQKTGKITIVIPNHTSVFDAEVTLLHESVAHYGLRQLFGEHFNTFLDNVFENADESIRHKIIGLAKKHGWDFHTATEEYLAGLAEQTNFDAALSSGWWSKIKTLFLEMLRKIGFEGFGGVTLTDNELRYILWRSYENLKEPGRFRNILGQAADIAKQYELKVGDYAEKSQGGENAADAGNELFRDGDPEVHERELARWRYDQRVRSGMFQAQEALQDSMLGLKEAMLAILGKGTDIEDVAGFENAYLGENRLSSVNKAEADAFARILFKPLLQEVSKLAPTKKDRELLTDYMMAKHGLERNLVMAERDAQEAFENNLKEHPHSTKTLQDFLDKYRERDYAGLTSLTANDDVASAEAEAQQIVDDYEMVHNTDELWEKVNAVSKATLQKSYECGMMSKDIYEKISGMYDYYIPLRGFDETTSEEVYSYLNHRNSIFNAPIKKARGRSSKADDPFAYLQSMAESVIVQGNRNKLVKQRFLNFALNHPSDLVSISDLWVKYDKTLDEWVPVFPDNIENNDTPDDVERKMQEFEEKMMQLAEAEPDLYKRGKDAENIPYRVVDSRDLRQHQVVVKRNGRDYVITINGNPRAAQALNGQTNPDNEVAGAIGSILRAGENLNRHLSAFYTTRNPDFVVSNFVRDLLYTNTMAWIKESPNYALRFHRNYLKANPVQMKILLAKLRNGTLDMDDKMESMFYQFMMNGGETGYANLRDIEQHKNDIRRELKKAGGKISVRRAWALLSERLDELNRSVENCARFAAFVTSREMGRSLDRSIYDAKEISVNFNKKGSGAKFFGKEGQTKLGNIAAFTSGIGRSGYVFWNAAIQGTTNFGRQFKKYPAKAYAGVATMFLLGALVAYLGGDDDDTDDKNAYYNLPEYVRRSNLLFRAGDSWISLPLPVEYRALYGMGELMMSTLNGKEHYTGEELAEQIAAQVSQILPLDLMNDGGLMGLIPSSIKPFAEVHENKSWTGLPIYKDTPWNKNMPEWTKAYQSANRELVNLAAVLNEVSGGDKYTKGYIDINPAKVEHLLEGYFGGVASTIDKLSKTVETVAGAREYDPRNLIFINRLVKAGDERTEYRAVNNEYFRIKEEHDKIGERLRSYEKDTDNGVFDYAEKIDFLYNTPEYERWEIFEEYKPEIDALYDEMDIATADERKEIEVELNELKKEMIQEMNLTRK